MTKDDRYAGHYMIEQLEAMLQRRRERRAQEMPTEADALRAYEHAYQRLTDFGWLPGNRSPNDGTPFLGIMPGQRAPFVFVRFGDYSYLRDDFRLYAGEPVLFKPCEREG